MGLIVLPRAVMIKQVRTKDKERKKEKPCYIRIDFAYMLFSEEKKKREKNKWQVSVLHDKHQYVFLFGARMLTR